ncbi:hypothetical protein AAY473_003823 [Plecturocebus cupreus]
MKDRERQNDSQKSNRSMGMSDLPCGSVTREVEGPPLPSAVLEICERVGVSLCCLGWSALVQSQLTAISATQVQVFLLPCRDGILSCWPGWFELLTSGDHLPQPPKVLGLQARATAPGRASFHITRKENSLQDSRSFSRTGLIHLLPRRRGNRFLRVVPRSVLFIILFIFIVPLPGFLLVCKIPTQK